MSIFTYFRGLFSKNIFFKNDKKGHLVYVYHGKGGKIWFDKTITVPENMEFYFAKNGLVLDGFTKGEHDIVPMYLSKTIKALKLGKKNKKVKNLKYFVADGYFVSLNQSDTKDWKLFAKAEFFDESLGVFKTMLKGKYIVKVSNAKQFLKRLLLVYDYLKSGEAEQILEGFISESVYKILRKTEVNLSLLQDKNKLTDFLFDNILKGFENSGIEILGFSVDEVIFSKKVKEKIKEIEIQEKINAKIKLLKEKLPELEDENKEIFVKEDKILPVKEVFEPKTNEIGLERKDILLESKLKAKAIQKADESKETSFEANKVEDKNASFKTNEIESLISFTNKYKLYEQESNQTQQKQKANQEKMNEDFDLNKIDTNKYYEYTNSINQKHKTIIENQKVAKKEDMPFIKCPICGERNQESNKHCGLCKQKL